MSILEEPETYLFNEADKWFVVIPVTKSMVPSVSETPYFIELYDGQKLYFENSPENELLSDEEWLNKQIAGGNFFLFIPDGERYKGDTCFFETVSEFEKRCSFPTNLAKLFSGSEHEV